MLAISLMLKTFNNERVSSYMHACQIDFGGLVIIRVLEAMAT